VLFRSAFPGTQAGRGRRAVASGRVRFLAPVLDGYWLAVVGLWLVTGAGYWPTRTPGVPAG
jgi:hypothetical protein